VAVKGPWCVYGVGDGERVILTNEDTGHKVFVSTGDGDSFRPRPETWLLAAQIAMTLNDYDRVSKENKRLLTELEKARTDARMMRVALEQERERKPC
jgi:hypothetical protein